MMITKILSNPNYEPPENLLELELNLNEGLRGLLRSPGLSKETIVRFSIGEAELTLPIFEAEYPDDHRPREAIKAARDWLSNPSSAEVARAAAAAAEVAAADAAAYAGAAAAWTPSAAAAAYAAASAAARAAYAVADAAAYAASAVAYWARVADPRVTEEHQIIRFLDLFKEKEPECSKCGRIY